MKKSKFVRTINETQKAITPFLREFGFYRKGRNYNRCCSDGIVHVINFQMGQYPLEKNEIPDIRKNLYGRFTVNLGVLISCVDQLEFQRKAKSFYKEHDCHIRARLGLLIDDGYDMWWNLDQKPEKLRRTILPLLQNYGLPFIDQFSGYKSIIVYYLDHQTLPFNSAARSALLIALIYCAMGEEQIARKYFDQALEVAMGESSHLGFLEHIRVVRERCL